MRNGGGKIRAHLRGGFGRGRYRIRHYIKKRVRRGFRFHGGRVRCSPGLLPACGQSSHAQPVQVSCTQQRDGRRISGGAPVFRYPRADGGFRELYPRGRVNLLSVKTFNSYNIDKALINAAAVMKVANTPMTYMFEDVIVDKGEELPPVESVKYEDGKGLICWVGGERLLLGTRELMEKYSIDLPSLDFEESNKLDEQNCVTYLANAGQLVAMLITEYTADKHIVSELKRLEKSGVTPWCAQPTRMSRRKKLRATSGCITAPSKSCRRASAIFARKRCL